MKKTFLQFLALILLLVSCSTDNNNPESSENPETEIEDTFNYLALRANGNLYEIGNKTGEVTAVGSISAMRGNLNMIPSTVTASAEKIFIYEHLFDPFHGRVLVMDKETRSVEVFALDFPVEIYGENAGLNSLDWDAAQGNLVGIVKDEMEYNNNNTSRVVRIDPETMALSYEGISFDHNITLSTSLLGNKLYALSSTTGELEDAELLEIDLSTKTLEPLEISDTELFMGNLANNGKDNFLFGLMPVRGSSLMGEMEAYKLNLTNNEFEALPEIGRFSGRHIARKSFYNKEFKEFAELIYKANKNQLLQYNHQENELSALELIGAGDFDTSVIIIDYVKVQ